uniref:Uncharacterized protein n=1 Tax=Megaselia scalaris TaxID=36166 RepID=T1H134_MEGSC
MFANLNLKLQAQNTVGLLAFSMEIIYLLSSDRVSIGSIALFSISVQEKSQSQLSFGINFSKIGGGVQG